MKNETNKNIVTEEKSQILSLVSGVVTAYAITVIIFVGYAILLKYSKVNEDNTSLVVTVTSIIAVIIAGFDAAKGAANKGWLWGILAGLFYAIILMCIGSFVNKSFAFDSSSITLLVLSIASGGLGGVIGINMKK